MKINTLESLQGMLPEGSQVGNPIMLGNVNDGSPGSDVLKQLLGNLLGGMPPAPETEQAATCEDAGDETPTLVDDEPVDELDARSRITAAVRAEFADDDEKIALWSANPENLFVKLEDGDQKLVQGIMDESMTVEAVRLAIAEGHVEYREVEVPTEAPTA